jgi:hypothetical protein
MREAIDAHIANVNASVGNILSDNSYNNAAGASKDCLFLGSVTSRFTPFIINLKDIEV